MIDTIGRLYELIDWSCLEFYDTDRMIFIGAKKKDEEPVRDVFNSEAIRSLLPPVYDAQRPDVIVREEQEYWPRVDVTVTAGDGVIKGKQATLRVLEAIAQMNITADNWKIIAAELEILDIPQKKEIIEGWRARFEAPAPAAVPPTVPPAGAIETPPVMDGFDTMPALPMTEGAI